VKQLYALVEGITMAEKRIIAYFMHEEERHAALQKMTQVIETDSYLLGEINEEDIEFLQQQGLIIKILEEEVEIRTPGRRWRLTRDRRGGTPAYPPHPLIDPNKPNFYFIQIKGPLVKEWQQELDHLGVELLEYIPHYAYTSRLTPDQARNVKTLPFVSVVRIYGPEDSGAVTVSPDGPHRPYENHGRAPHYGSATPTEDQAIVTYVICLHREEDREMIKEWLHGYNVNTVRDSRQKIWIHLPEGCSLTYEIASKPEVALIEKVVPKELHNNVARSLLRIDQKEGDNPGASLSQTGKGQIVAIADTGLDDSHPDFHGRIVDIVALGRPGDSSDPHGHGTHVAGSALGDGTASGGKIRGTAPGAKLFFQSLLDDEGGLSGLPQDLGDLFEKAYDAGARIHNNSWGATTQSRYTVDSIEVDEFVANHRDMVIVISAGNEGRAACNHYSERGFLDWYSIGSPASSKNALTVGASRSSRTENGYTTFTYGTAWPYDYVDPPIADENVSGNPEGLAAFSSRGPCDDERIKPDVVAPGTDIVSAKSRDAPSRNFWGAYPRNRYYAFLGGTSMAAPLVSGCAALVREYYIKEHAHHPSAALVKASLINSTKWLTHADAVADHPHLPNIHQGFGCIYMPWAIPTPSEPDFTLEFLDTWMEPEKQFRESGQQFKYRFSISGGKWLRICLVWTDKPARSLQNNLNLFIEHEQSQQKWEGNQDLPGRVNKPAYENNVEVVRLENPLDGDYIIQVSAENVLIRNQDDILQDFALVVSGSLTSSLVEILH
jgi:subtilisin family serine protease